MIRGLVADRATLAFENLALRQQPSGARQSPFVERFIGSLRRECLDHVIVLTERHLHRIVSE
jgi:hypothetical protein